MTAVGAWLLAVGLADLIAGLSGLPGRRTRAAVAAAPPAALVTALAGGLSPRAAVAVALLAGASAWPWLAARRPADWSVRRATLTLASAGAVTGLMVASAAWWPQADGGALARWLTRLPYPLLAAIPGDRFVLGAGAATALLASGNAVVRLVLAASGARTRAAEQQLRGGRVLGPLERLLILAFAVSGQLTAAAFLVTAKGLLRFPELVRSSRVDSPRGVLTLDVVTEYLLLGSLASWALALAPAVLLAG